MTIKIKVLDHAKEIYRGHSFEPATSGSAGIDLMICHSNTLGGFFDDVITAHKLGVSVAIPKGYVGILLPRSSSILRMTNSAGVIDSDYRGELIAKTEGTYKPERKLQFQLIVVPYISDVQVVEQLNDTIRGSGGFGSTNEKPRC